MAIISEQTDYTILTTKESLEAIGFYHDLESDDFRFLSKYGTVIIKKDSINEFTLFVKGCSVGRHLKYINHVKDMLSALYAEEY